MIVRNPQFYVELQPKPRNSGITHPTDFPCQYPKTSYHCALNDPPVTSVANFWWIWWSKPLRVFFVVIGLWGLFFCTHHIRAEKILWFYARISRCVTKYESSNALQSSRVYDRIPLPFWHSTRAQVFIFWMPERRVLGLTTCGGRGPVMPLPL